MLGDWGFGHRETPNPKLSTLPKPYLNPKSPPALIPRKLEADSLVWQAEREDEGLRYDAGLESGVFKRHFPEGKCLPKVIFERKTAPRTRMEYPTKEPGVEPCPCPSPCESTRARTGRERAPVQGSGVVTRRAWEHCQGRKKRKKKKNARCVVRVRRITRRIKRRRRRRGFSPLPCAVEV